MAQTDIIQKDLGLVTAYGYALAGGYQGTEAQFKIDFANLMAGKYSGSECKYYGYGRGTWNEVFSSDYGSVVTGVWTYGNISYFTANIETTSAITIDTVRDYVEICGFDTNDGNISVDNALKYVPLRDYVASLSSEHGTSIFGFEDLQGRISEYARKCMVIPLYKCTQSNGSISRVHGGISLTLVDPFTPYTIPSDERIWIHGMFFNRIGNP